MTNLQQLQENINNILIELTDITGFDHGSKALEAFASCEDKIKSIMQKAYQLGQQDTLERERTRIAEEVENLPYILDVNIARYRDKILSIIKQGK
jgi:hypothetical protein